MRSNSVELANDEGNAILYSNGNYRHNLMLARLGNLPFLFLASIMIFLWAHRWFTAASGVWAVFLFLNLPPILGHAALATLDMGCAATVVTALYFWMRWLESPGPRQAVGMGIGFSA
ncbi:MAG: hypothetical protein ABIZ80_03825, partial [Bryobacteraceae bacterium]